MSSPSGSSSLTELFDAARGAAASGRGLPPVHLWNPPHCGEIDIRIRPDGTWLHEGTPIGRPALVRLFSTVLRKDADGIYLVTPVEKLKITVEDAPGIGRAWQPDRAGARPLEALPLEEAEIADQHDDRMALPGGRLAGPLHQRRAEPAATGRRVDRDRPEQHGRPHADPHRP